MLSRGALAGARSSRSSFSPFLLRPRSGDCDSGCDNSPSRGIGIPLSRFFEVKEVDDGDAAEYGKYDFVRRTVNKVSIKEAHSAVKSVNGKKVGEELLTYFFLEIHQVEPLAPAASRLLVHCV